MANTTTDNMDELLFYKIASNGKAIDSTFRLSSLQTNQTVNRIGKATLCFDSGNIDDYSFPESDSDTFKPGAEISISIGYTAGKEETIFEGIVISQSLRIETDIRPQLIVECRDYTYPATQGRKNAVFEKKSDSTVISTILKKYGLSASGSSTSFEHEKLIQYYCTDWDFIRSRAEACVLVICTVGKKVTIKQPEVSAAPVLTLKYGKDMFSFNGTLSASEQFTKTEAVTWDIHKQSLSSVQSATPRLNQQGNMAISDLSKINSDNSLCQSDAGIPKEAMKIWADAQALRSGLSRYQGDFTFAGNASVTAGCIISLDNTGKRFNGYVYAGGVEHSLKDGLWITRVIMGLPSDNVTDLPDVPAPPVSGSLPGISGLHIGKVKQIADDPQKEFRILVEIPILNGKPNEIWARLSTLYASNGLGSYFLPEKNDEVIIGFFNNDPNYPVILGSMFSSKQAMPYTPDEKNEIKAIVSREKLKIEFDEKKKIICLTTPNKNKIEINDDGKYISLKDQNKNEIVMEAGGITLNSCKDLTLKAKGNILVDAGMELNEKAKTNVTTEGMNVKITAKMGVTVKGSATAELSASGQTTVKGGIVMIN